MKNFIYTAFCIFLIANVNANEVVLQTQQDVDYYGQAGYSWFPGTVRIKSFAGQDSSTMITDLSPLLVFDSIPGSLIIENTILTNLHGLENLKVGYVIDVYENAELVDASALSLTGKFTELKFLNNPKLEILPSTANFIELRGGVEIINNSALKEVVVELNATTSWVTIRENRSLETVSITDNSSVKMKTAIYSNEQLKNIFIYTEEDTCLIHKIFDNPNLEIIEGFGKVHYIGFAEVYNNPKLNELCHLQKILTSDGIDFLFLDSNGTNANSEADILATDCSDFNTSVTEVANADLSIYPNPAQNEVFVKGISQPTLYAIYDRSGKQITQGTVNPKGSIDLTAVKAGMYILKIENQHHKLLVE